MEEKKEVTIQEIQSKLLEILLYFQKFCQENGPVCYHGIIRKARTIINYDLFDSLQDDFKIKL